MAKDFSKMTDPQLLALTFSEIADAPDEIVLKIRALMREQDKVRVAKGGSALIPQSKSVETDWFDAMPIFKGEDLAALKRIVSAVKAHYSSKDHVEDCDYVGLKIDRDGLKFGHVVPLYDKDEKGKPINTKLAIDELGKGKPATAWKF